MSAVTYIFSVLAASMVVVVVISMLVTKRLRERHAFWWLLIGALMLLSAIFPPALEGVADVLGIKLPISLVFFSGILVLFLVSVQHAAELTKLEDQNRELAEAVALQDLRLRQLEASITPSGGSDS